MSGLQLDGKVQRECRGGIKSMYLEGQGDLVTGLLMGIIGVTMGYRGY